MKLNKHTIRELEIILKQEYKVQLERKELERFARSLVGYFALLTKGSNRHEFGNSPRSLIDNKIKEVLDRKEK